MRVPLVIHRLVDRYRHRFLRAARGVVHVGANTGQERELYAHFQLDVLWIEPLSDVFTALERNIRAFPRQRALRARVTDRDDGEYAFRVANNRGQSSLLPRVKFIKAEAADFDAYVGAARLDDLEAFLGPHGYGERHRYRFARRPAGGCYYEVIWSRSGCD